MAVLRVCVRRNDSCFCAQPLKEGDEVRSIATLRMQRDHERQALLGLRTRGQHLDEMDAGQQARLHHGLRDRRAPSESADDQSQATHSDSPGRQATHLHGPTGPRSVSPPPDPHGSPRRSVAGRSRAYRAGCAIPL